MAVAGGLILCRGGAESGSSASLIQRPYRYFASAIATITSLVVEGFCSRRRLRRVVAEVLEQEDGIHKDEAPSSSTASTLSGCVAVSTTGSYAAAAPRSFPSNYRQPQFGRGALAFPRPENQLAAGLGHQSLHR